MFLDPTLVIFLALFVASFVVQSEWLFFVSVCLLVGFLYLTREEKKVEAAAEKETGGARVERKVIVLREPVHEPMHEKLPLELADEVDVKAVIHPILKNIYTFSEIEKEYGPEHHGGHGKH